MALIASADAKIRRTLRAAFAKTSATRLVAIVWVGGLIGILLRAVLFGGFLVNSHGQPLPGEFLAFWSAGQMAASGHPADAYDIQLLHQLQVQDTGVPFGGYFMWLFPPPFFLVAALLAQLPYIAAFALWAIATLVIYAICVDRLFRNRAMAIAYGLSPAAFVTFIVAQNGLLTAALFGGALLTLKRMPIVSGLLLAALVIKPQFGLLFPAALIAGSHWKALATAAIATGLWVLALLMMDPALASSFAHALGVARVELLTLGHQGWNKLQSVYGLLRIIGLGDEVSSVLAALLGLALLVAVFATWRSRLSFPMKAAILVVSSLAVSPYSYVFDFPLLTIAVGYLWRDADFDRFEHRSVIVSYVFIAVAAATGTPLGLFALCAVALVVGRRLMRQPFPLPS